MALTADNARAIADQFDDAYKAVNQYLDDHWQTISRSDYDTLNEWGKTLNRASSAMRTEAVGLSIDQMADAAAELTNVIGKARECVSRFERIGSVIRVVSGLVDLANGILGRNPGAVLKATIKIGKEVADA